VKARDEQICDLSYPQFRAFGTKLATLFSYTKTDNYLKIYNEEFCWFRVLLG